MIEWFAFLMIGIGLVFFIGGSIGLLRLPDLYSRLHALTKADNIGLACTLIGVGLLASSLLVTVKLLLIWICINLASASAAHLIAQQALRDRENSE